MSDCKKRALAAGTGSTVHTSLHSAGSGGWGPRKGGCARRIISTFRAVTVAPAPHLRALPLPGLPPNLSVPSTHPTPCPPCPIAPTPFPFSNPG